MTTKEKTAGTSTRWQASRPKGIPLSSGLSRFAERGVYFLLGGVLSGAELFGTCAPFGVAMVGAVGGGLNGFCTLMGSCLGYLTLQGLVGGLRYGAAAILTYAVAFAFYDLRLYRQSWFMPMVTGGLCALTGLLSLAEGGWQTASLIYYATELCFGAGAVCLYQGVLHALPNDWEEAMLTVSQRTGLLALAATILLSLANIQLIWGLSFGRIVAVVAVLLAARRGPNLGALTGAAAGVILDIASGLPPYYSMVFAVAGGCAGLCWHRSTYMAALTYVLANGLAVLWTWESGIRVELLYEVFVASVAFVLLPRRIRRVAGQMLAVPKPRSTEWERVRKVVTQRMKSTAQAFRDLYDNLREGTKKGRDNGEDTMVIFHRAAERQCRRCALRDTCWQRDYQTTCNACNEASSALMERGRAQPEDFPSHFTSRCVHIPEFIMAVNEEVTAFLYRRQVESKMKESRAALCRQYAELDRILDQAAAELSAEITPDLPREHKLRTFLRARGLAETGAVYYDENGRLRVETPDSDLFRREEGRVQLSKVLGVSLSEPEEGADGRLFFAQLEPFQAMASVSGRNKAGQSVSGDTGTWFRRADGLLCILLCDGMGSGPEAREESSLAVRLLQNFLKAGVEPASALGTVNAALALRNEEGGGCTTIDLLTVELLTGLCCIYKFGAAPTYLRRQGKVSCVTGTTLPAGVIAGEQVKPDVMRFRAEEGDWIVLLSDGIIGTEEDLWLRDLLGSFTGKSPGALADQIVAQSESQHKGADDSTVIAVRLERRQSGK